ncbi:MAG: CSLREA domain-containing protein [Thermoanaerobaculia bacterium]|nr:CSLREA domain-containing protein [Thermoanaerobaculia bacterium]
MFERDLFRAVHSAKRFVLLSLTLTLAAVSLPMHGAEIIVNTTSDGIVADSRCTLREAIDSANADEALHGCTEGSGHDTILLAFSGDHAITVAGSNEDLNQTGDFDVYDDLTIRPQSDSLVRIDGNVLDRVFEVFDGADLRLEGIELRDGDTVGFGGCIFVRTATSKLELRSSILSRCRSTLFGGGISSEGPTTLVDSFVNSGESAFGGGIYMSSSSLLTLERSEVLNSYATADGGAIHASNAWIDSSSVYFSLADRDGGGVFMAGDSLSDAVRFVNSTIARNFSKGDGGGLFVGAVGSLELFSSTVAFNEADTDMDDAGDGGGFYVESGILRTRNTAFGGNADLSAGGSEAPDCFGSVDSLGHNLFSVVGFGCSITGMTGSDQAGTLASPLDPVLDTCLEPVGDFGTSVLSPFPTSPLLDAGEPAGCQGPTGEILAMDQSRRERIWDGPDGDTVATCDIGSVEFGAPEAVGIFADGFESGNLMAWSSSLGGSLSPRRPVWKDLARHRIRALVEGFGGCE